MSQIASEPTKQEPVSQHQPRESFCRFHICPCYFAFGCHEFHRIIVSRSISSLSSETLFCSSKNNFQDACMPAKRECAHEVSDQRNGANNLWALIVMRFMRNKHISTMSSPLISSAFLLFNALHRHLLTPKIFYIWNGFSSFYSTHGRFYCIIFILQNSLFLYAFYSVTPQCMKSSNSKLNLSFQVVMSRTTWNRGFV